MIKRLRGVSSFANIIPKKSAPKKWWLMGSNSRIFYAGFDSAGFVNNAELNGAVTGLTLISDYLQSRVRQFGYIRQIKLLVISVGLGVLKFKLFRPNGANYDFVAESIETLLGNGTQTINLTSPLPCQPGDVIGIFLYGDPVNGNLVKIACKNAIAPNTIKYTVGDITGSDPFAISLGNLFINIEGLGISPYLTICGDSISAGYNFWQSFYDFGPSGTLISEPWYKLRAFIKDTIDQGFEYQNHGDGGATFADLAGSEIATALITLPRAILILCGVNDVQNGRTWADVLTDLNTIRLLISSEFKLYICEILPWTNGTNANAVTIRTWNVNLSNWCKINQAQLIRCHNIMGQIRPATGYLDDLKTQYDSDGVHLTDLGYSVLAFTIRGYLN